LLQGRDHLVSLLKLLLQQLLSTVVALAVLALGRLGLRRLTGLGWYGQFGGLAEPALLYGIDFLDVDIPFSGDLLLTSLQFLDDFQQSHLSSLPLDDLLLAMFSIYFKFLDLIVEGLEIGTLSVLQSKDVRLESLIFLFEFDDVLLEGEDEFGLIVHTIQVIMGSLY
jgi:hypothetical protein